MDLDLWDCFWKRKVYIKDEMTNLHICCNFGRVNSRLIDE